MKNKISTILLVIVMIILIVCLVTLGLVVYVTFQNEDNEVRKFLGDTYEVINTALHKEEISNVENNNLLNDQEYNIVNSKVSNYYYEQLDDYAKIIYNKLNQNRESLKTGTYKIQFGNTFDELLNEENGSELLGKYYQSAIETYFYDNPEIFYIEPSKMYINIKKTTKTFKTTYDVYIDCGNEENYLLDEYNSVEQINEREEQIEQIKNNLIWSISRGNDYDKILTIHDYLINNISYDETISKANIYNVYGALVNKECVCEGYAKAFKYLLDEVGIENIIVIGTAVNTKNSIENHAWNYVKLDNNWYAVDTTWDDPIIRGSGFASNSYKYKYFMVGSDVINKDHTPIYQFTTDGKEYEYPILNKASYKKK